ncbi:MAG: hypothetical protein WC498_04230 [Candidatus Saccharimonadales bacterium]
MATQISTIQMRRGTSAQWTAANPILSAGEWGFETDTKKLKIGDGTTTWAALAYAFGGVGISGTPTAGQVLTATSPSAANWQSAKAQDISPTDYGFTAWAFDPTGLGGLSIAPTLGSLFLFRMDIRVATTASKVVVALLSNGSALANCFAGIYSSAGALLAGSADISATLAGAATNSDVILNLSGTASLASGSFVWAALLENGTTATNLIVSRGNALVGSSQLTGATARFGTFGSGLTALPASITPASITKWNSTMPWAGII